MVAKVYVGGGVITALDGGITAGAATCNILDSSGWPSSGPFTVTINEGLSNEETILVDSRTANTLNFNGSGRGYDDTSAFAHASASEIKLTPTAEDFQEANDHINSAVLDHHTQYMKADGTRHDDTARHEAGTVVPTAAASAVAIDDTAAEGVATTAARSDHGHAVTGGSPVSVGTALADGAATTFARSNHVHDLGSGSVDDLTLFASDIRPVIVSATAPSSPITGQRYITPSDLREWIWDGTAWVYHAGPKPSAIITDGSNTSIGATSTGVLPIAAGDVDRDTDSIVDTANNRLSPNMVGWWNITLDVVTPATDSFTWAPTIYVNGTQLTQHYPVQNTAVFSSWGPVTLSHYFSSTSDTFNARVFNGDSNSRQYRIKRLTAVFAGT